PSGPSDDRFLRRPSPPPPPPAPPTVVSGIVTDSPYDHPVHGARVEWVGAVGAWGDNGDGVLTEDNGAYTMSVGPLGGLGEQVVVVRARREEYRGDQKLVRLDSSEVTV